MAPDTDILAPFTEFTVEAQLSELHLRSGIKNGKGGQKNSSFKLETLPTLASLSGLQFSKY